MGEDFGVDHKTLEAIRAGSAGGDESGVGSVGDTGPSDATVVADDLAKDAFGVLVEVIPVDRFVLLDGMDHS